MFQNPISSRFKEVKEEEQGEEWEEVDDWIKQQKQLIAMNKQERTSFLLPGEVLISRSHAVLGDHLCCSSSSPPSPRFLLLVQLSLSFL